MSSTPARPTCVSRGTLLGLIVVAVGCRLAAWRACPLYDDAFITYRYAQNLAEGQGLVFNPGAAWEPILGTTTPLYALILAGLAWLSADLTSAARALNLVCDALTVWLLARALGARPWTLGLAVCGFAALPFLERISAGGMEPPLFLLLALAAADRLHAERPGQAGLWAALLCTVRPEGVLLVGVALVQLLRQPRALARFLVPVALIGSAALWLLVQSYGSPVPQSVRAKSHMQAEAWERMRAVLEQSFAPHPVLWLLAPLVAWGLWRLVARPSALRTLSAFSLAITASYLIARPHVWGWYFYVPLTVWVLALATALDELLIARLKNWSTAHLRWIGGATLAGVVGVSVVRPSPVPEHVYRPLQAWARATSEREPAARILASDIGAIGWGWRGVVLDSEGLTWPGALDFGHPNAIAQAHWPEYLLIVAERDRVAPVQDDPLMRARYEPIARFAPDGATELHPAPAELPARWKQDYLVYRLRPAPR